MIDYVRETNSLKDCKRCLLCLKRADLRCSHIVPKSILKKIAKDLVVKKDEQKVFVPLLGKTIKKSPAESTFWLLCSDCENAFVKMEKTNLLKKFIKKCALKEMWSLQGLPYVMPIGFMTLGLGYSFDL